MREFSNNILEAYVNGLRSSERQFRSAESLYEAQNIRCSSNGIEPPIAITNKFSGEPFSHPFPQILKTRTRIFLCNETEINIVDPSTDPWTATAINVVNLDGTQGTISAGGQWHLIDLDDDFYLMNGSSVVFTDPLDTLSDAERVYYVADNIQIKTGLYHQGRAILGGLDGNSFWTGYWMNVFDEIRDISNSPNILSSGGINKNTLFWSSIGANDFPNWLYFPRRAFFGNEDNALETNERLNIKQTAFYEALLRNEFGFMNMTFSDEVLTALALGQNVVVYGRDGITLLSPYLSRDSQISTYAKQRVSDVGIASRSAVGGSDQIHLFVDQAGDLWRYTGEGLPEFLGYKEYISTMTLSDITITYNEHEKDFYISDGTKSFLLSPSGLTELDRPITSGFRYRGEFVGQDDEPASEEVLITSAPYDFGVRGIKTITSLLIAAKYTGTMDVAVDFRYSDTEEWTRTAFVEVNKESGAVIRISGVDFRFVVRCSDNTGFNIDYMQVRWQASDKRQIRGAYAGPSST